MFTPVGAATKLSFAATGSKTVTVPANMNAVRIMSQSSVQVAFDAASASQADMTVMGQANAPATEIFGVTAADNLSVYAQGGASVELQFGTVAYDPTPSP